MGDAAAIEFVVEIRVRIEVKEVQAGVGAGMGAHQRIGDGVVAAERDDGRTLTEQSVEVLLDLGK